MAEPKKKAATKKAPTKKAATKKTATKKTATKKGATKKTAGRRADFGAPIDGFFAKQQPALAPILLRLRALVEEVAPAATATLKWGMPFYTIGDELICALAGFKAHVNLILPGGPGTYADPEERLQGEGKTGQHLKLRTLAELPEAAVRGWLKTAVKRAHKE